MDDRPVSIIVMGSLRVLFVYCVIEFEVAARATLGYFFKIDSVAVIKVSSINSPFSK